MNFNPGDRITYSSAAGRQTATVNEMRVLPTARLGHSIPWLFITVTKNGRSSSMQLPADEDCLKMYDVKLV